MKNFQLFDSTEMLDRLNRIKNSLFFLGVFISLAILGCDSKKEANVSRQNQLVNDFTIIDSLYLTMELNRSVALLDSLRPTLHNDDVVNFTNYYYYKGACLFRDMKVSKKYADSALHLYANPKTQLLYPDSYLKALMLQTEIYIALRQYETALEYFFKIKPLLSKSLEPTNYANYLSRIALIYYNQGKFKTSASYNKQAIEVLSKLTKERRSMVFYLKQGAINNAGFSYELANLLDSAEFFYRKGLAYVEAQATAGTITVNQANASRIVLLDNLGGLMAKKGNLANAEKLLEQSVSIQDSVLESSKATAYLKLADTYGKLGKIAKADSTFNIAEKIIYADKIDQFELKLRFQKAKSDWLFFKQDYKQAYAYLDKYYHLTDSTNKLKRTLSQIDLKLKFENLQTKEDVVSLEKTNKSKNAYLVAVGLFLMMLAPIIILVLKNTRQSRRAAKETVKHNIVLEKTMKRLELRNKDYAKMMKVMAHDLKNPLGGMVGVANLLLEDDRFAKEDKELLYLIESSGENAIEMINQLLNSGLAVENEELKKENIDLQHLLRQCTELLQYKADEKKQKIVFVSGGPVIALLSKEKIWRVLNNLIVNAIKFSPENAEIKVVLEHLAKSVKISIIDQGIGVPQKDKEKIFEMFTSAKRPGTAGEQPFGIGLSISKQIIESHDGKIWLDENPLGGTIFYVELPLTKKHINKLA